MEGHLDWADRHIVRGWAWHRDRPEVRARVGVLVDGVREGDVIADNYREDLRAGGIGDGHVSFTFTFWRLVPHTARRVSLVDAATGKPIPGAELDLPGAPGFDAAARGRLDAAVQAALGQARSAAELAEVKLLLLGAATARPVAGGRRLAVVIDFAVPRPDRDAGSQAVMSHMRALRRLGHAVLFLHGSDLPFDREAAERLASEGIVCADPAEGGPATVLRARRAEIAVVYMHRLSAAAAWADVARAWCPGARLVYSLADLHHLRLQRMQTVTGRVAPVAAMRAAELAAARAVDAVITHSAAEAAILAQAAPELEIHVVPWEVALPPEPGPAEGRSGVVFLGSYAHLPNLDAARILLERVMPEVWAQDPSITLTLAGSDMPAEIRAAEGPGVRVLGHVADPQAVYAGARLSVAPLRFGAGLKGKVLESFAAGLPCIGSPVAVEGMGLPPALLDCVAGSPSAMVATILRLHADPAACAALGAAGREWVAATFSPARIDAGLNAALGYRPIA